MKMSEAFPGNFLKAGDLKGRAIKLTISHVGMEKVGDDDNKPVLFFLGAKKGLVLNKTNSNTIVDLYGDDSDEWKGRELEVYPDRTDFRGERVDCIRVRGIAPPPAPELATDGADIPF